MFEGAIALQVRALRPADDAEPVVLRHGALEHRERGLHQRDVHHLPEPAAQRVSPVERRQDPLRREHPREGVAERDVHPRRGLAGEAVDVPDPAHRLRHGREARALRVRAGLPVTGDAREDEPRVDLAQPLVAEVPLLERPGPEVLHQHVRVLREPEQQRLPLLVTEVQRDALLVARLHGPPERAALVAGLAPVPDRVGTPWRLDLDDLRPQIAQQAPGERPGEELPELHDPHARERAAGFGRGCLPALPRRVGHVLSTSSRARACSSSTWATRTSRASSTCSFITSSARSASRRSSARVIWR